MKLARPATSFSVYNLSHCLRNKSLFANLGMEPTKRVDPIGTLWNAIWNMMVLGNTEQVWSPYRSYNRLVHKRRERHPAEALLLPPYSLCLLLSVMKFCLPLRVLQLSFPDKFFFGCRLESLFTTRALAPLRDQLQRPASSTAGGPL